jgi:hypothetical protein
MDLFILLIAYSSVEFIFLVLDSNYWYSGNHAGDGVLDRIHSGTNVVIDPHLTVSTTEQHLLIDYYYQLKYIRAWHQ